MNSKTMRFLLVIVVAVLATLTTAIVAASASSWSLPWEAAPPPPTPTSFPPPPTPTPAKVGTPVITSRDQAIEQALLCDSYVAIRERPLTKEMIAANPDMIMAEPYASQQEAFDVYRMGGVPDKGPPVWVVIVKGKVSVRLLGLSATKDPKESNGVTYFISQVDGALVGIRTGIAQKWGERSP